MDIDYYQREYVENERSTYEIAEDCRTYPNRIRRELRRLGFTLRSKSEAQAIALRRSRHKHPTRGKPLDDTVKHKIQSTLKKRTQTQTQRNKSNAANGEST